MSGVFAGDESGNTTAKAGAVARSVAP